MTDRIPQPSVYIRVSTIEQADEGFSIAAQEAKLKGYCELHNFGDPLIFTDPGYSGGNMNRPALQELISEVARGDISHVLVWRLDRLSRSLKDILTLSELFQKHDIAFISFCENFDTTTASGRLFFNISGVFAQFYRDQLSENVRMGMLQAVKEGRWINRPPTGYDLEDGLLTPNGDADRIRRAFQLSAKHNISLNEVGRQVGIKAPYLRYMLGNRAYIGEVRLADQWFPGSHKGLVDSDLFEAVQAIRQPYQRMWHLRSRQYLSGHLFCGYCKRALTVNYRGNGSGVVYQCKHRSGDCIGVGKRSKNVIEKGIINALIQLKNDPDLLKAIRKELRSGHDSYLKEANSQLKTIEKQLTSLGLKKKKILEAFFGGITSEILAEEEGSIKAQELSLQAEKENILKMLSVKRESIEDFDDFMKNFKLLDMKQAWDDATEDERQMLIQNNFKKIFLFPDRLEIHYHHLPPIISTWEDIKNRGNTSCVRGGS